MESLRKPFQGVTNIIKFNWHYYLLSAMLLVVVFVSDLFFKSAFHFVLTILLIAIIVINLVSLLVSYYVYDLSKLYSFNWIEEIKFYSLSKIVNIHAGFDETSILIKQKFPVSELTVFDFYNPQFHTEVSVKRARKAYPPFPGTIKISTTEIPINNNEIDIVFVIFSAHEIRNKDERTIFFSELKRILKPTGKIIVTEHLRDGINFIAYNIGAFHFLSSSMWESTFHTNNLKITKVYKTTKFVTNYILEKNGDMP